MTLSQTEAQTQARAQTQKPVLQVMDLEVTYYTDSGRARALDHVSFNLLPGEKLGLVGESGSGKSTMALAMMRMIKPPGRIEGGKVIVGDTDLTALSESEMRSARLSKISYIPQGAMNSLNPVVRIGAQMKDALKAHEPNMPSAEMQLRAEEALESVELKRSVARMYPHELSGGMKQRVCIAIGILLKPKVIIADEPTSALDVVTQRQVMETLDHIQHQLGAAIILIGHDMGLMAQFVDKVAVMYAGRFAELSTVREMFTDPMHPYAQALIESLPNLDNKGVFKGIPGLAPSLLRLPTGCAFHPRCPYTMEICKSVVPPFEQMPSGRFVACHLYDKNGNRINANEELRMTN
jgi:oligopeptide/dipeptide ABC transporter ATP-binding protein